MNDSVRQWNRVVQVVIGKGGSGVLVEDLRVQFKVTKTQDSTPNEAIIKIYNLSPENEAKIKNEFDEIILNAGYKGAAELVFRGNIKYVYRYKDGTDYITEIEAGDGDKDFTRAVMNETLAAGTTNSQLVDRAVGSFKGLGGTTKGPIQLNERSRLRGRVISGNTRDILRDISSESGADWSIQDGQLEIIKVDSIRPGEAILITAETGMLGAPEVNDKGIEVRCLLNPKIRINGALKLDNNGIKAKRLKEKAKKLGIKEEPQGGVARLDPDGIYKVIKLEHQGDNRSNEWESVSLCIALDAPIPAKKGK